MTTSLSDDGPAAAVLTAVARELAALRDLLLDQLLVGRTLSDATDWRSRSAAAFHARAAAWAHDVSRLESLAETARAEAVDAAGRAAARSAWEAAVARLGAST